MKGKTFMIAAIIAVIALFLSKREKMGKAGIKNYTLRSGAPAPISYAWNASAANPAPSSDSIFSGQFVRNPDQSISSWNGSKYVLAYASPDHFPEVFA